jgi:hypothetical protein
MFDGAFETRHPVVPMRQIGERWPLFRRHMVKVHLDRPA